MENSVDEVVQGVLNPRAVSDAGEASFRITHQAGESFIRAMQIERQRGFGFVPLIGAGFSAPSGAPLVEELKPYLRRCLLFALGHDNFEKPEWNWPNARWHPCTDRWPPFIDREFTQHSGSNYILTELVGQLTSFWERSANANEDQRREASVLSEALGATEEWRTALQFLSRLNHSPRGRQGSTVSLVAPRPEILDACLREVLRNRYPALNHRMLGVLAGVLRLNLVLTTNFDDLLERGFQDARNLLEVFEVHLDDELPHWSAVAQARSLVKLHGNRHLLRADYSLDKEPTQQDKDTFIDYLVGGKSKAKGGDDQVEETTDFRNHLLVMGVSLSDRRTLALIEHAWRQLDGSRFKIFWLCYSDRDVREIERFVATRLFKGVAVDGARVPIVLKHTHFGLLLLQLYQTIRRNLPPFGSVFPSVARLPLPPLTAAPLNHAQQMFCDELYDRVAGFQRNFESEKLRFIIAKTDATASGITSACSEAFRRLETRSICLWLDMNDIASTDDLFEVLLEAAYLRLGQEHWVPTHYETETEHRSDEIRRLMRSINRPWVIFFNARETPGANISAPGENQDCFHGNGWLDNLEIDSAGESGLTDQSNSAAAFLRLVRQLCGPDAARMTVVLSCRDASPPPWLLQYLEAQGYGDEYSLRLSQDSYAQPVFSASRVVARAIRWTRGEPARRRFLHALVLMQRPRLLATIWSEAASPETGGPVTEESADRPAWINDLEACGLIRRKPGGFIWMHSPSRELSRQILRGERALDIESDPSGEACAILGEWRAAADEADVHTELARWYEKVLDSSGAAGATFEAVYHWCLAATRHLQFSGDGIRLAQGALAAAAALLRVNAFLIQTRSYARGSCRRLNHIRRTLCTDILKESSGCDAIRLAVRHLRLGCTDLMRMIAREVGEDRKAFMRHQQYGELLAGLPFGDESLRETGAHKLSKEILRALEVEGEPERVEAMSDWARWWRWSGMLGMASRSFPAAVRALENALQCAIHPLKYPKSNWLPRPSELEASLGKIEFRSLRVEALRSLEQYVEVLSLIYGLEQRVRLAAKNDAAFAQWDRETEVQNILALIGVGRRLVARIRSADRSTDSRETMIANWCESRLLIHQSVCASRRFQIQLKDEDAQGSVMGLLGDAEAILRISDSRRYRSELGIVELHRTETRTQRAEAVLVEPPTSLRPQHLSISFSRMCRYMEARLLDAPSTEWARDWLRIDFPDGGGASLSRVRALVTDGVRFLERAEPILRERRRNMWWTTWFFERYLRLVAMAIWASVFERGSPIPFLGLEVAATGTSSVADELLSDALRMISVDSYRLATILDAYASCALALCARIIVEQNFDLRFRRHLLHENLRRGLEHLHNTEVRRGAPASLSPHDMDAHVDERIPVYIKAVRTRVLRIEKWVGKKDSLV